MRTSILDSTFENLKRITPTTVTTVSLHLKNEPVSPRANRLNIITHARGTIFRNSFFFLLISKSAIKQNDI